MAGPGVTSLRSLSPGRQAIIIGLIFGLIVGLAIAPFAFDASLDPQPDRVAVVPIAGAIDGQNAQDVTQRLTEVRQDRSVDAVVIVVNSPGGTAVASEEIFLQVERTAQEKPVVAVVDATAASGGYMAAIPADEIYVKPSSIIGSVGAILVRSDPLDPIDQVIETGAYKFDGDSPRGFEHSTQMIGKSFSGSVMEFRGDRLAMSRAELEQARIYTGVEGVELGLVDGTSDVQGGVQAAADLAELDDYDVDVRNYRTEVLFLDQATYAASDQPEKRMVTIDHFVETEDDLIVPQVLLLPHAPVTAGLDESVNVTDIEIPAEEDESEVDDG